MFFLRAAAIRELDRQMIEERKTAGKVLMRRAGYAVAQTINLLDQACQKQRTVTFVAGKGNNGGDAFVAARLLRENGWHVAVLMTHTPSALSNDAREAWNDLHKSGVEHIVWAAPEDWNVPDSATMPLGGIVVDALLGTGARGAPGGVIAAAIEWINAMRAHSLVLAIDIPSGIAADSGVVAGSAVNADITVTFVRPKKGFLNADAQKLLGHVTVADIGIDQDLVAAADLSADPAISMLDTASMRRQRPPREHGAHKGDFGHACIIGGASGFSGAPAIAAMAAMHAGAGLVTTAVPAELATAVAALAPETMVYPLPAPQGVITADALAAWQCPLAKFDAIAIGPGMTASPATRAAVQWVMDNYEGTIILDADALNVLPQVSLRAPQRLVLTPHPGEAARLLQRTTADIQADRCAAVSALAARYGGIVVLKGAGTLVCRQGETPAIVLAGNPGMATAGSGDALTGIIAALAAATTDTHDATRAAVWLHSAAGDFATWQHGGEYVTTRDIISALQYAFKLLRNPR